MRARERREVLRLLGSVGERPDRVVLVTGEAGMGKSHLARQVVGLLERQGHQVAWTRADPVERAEPYAAVAHLLWPGGVSPPWEPGGFDGPDAVLREVYRPVARELERRCAAGPLAVVIDDLHHTDEDTLELLGFLVRRLVDQPVVWLLTARTRLASPAPGLVRLVHRLGEDGRLDEVALGPLTDAETAALLAGVLGRPLPATVLDALGRRAAGNPYFAIQLSLSLDDAGLLDHADAPGAGAVLPSVSRRAALLERVVPRGGQARAVAGLAAVCGVLDLDQLEHQAGTVGLGRDEALDAFDRLVRADVLRHLGDGRYGFTHDLLGEALYEDLGPAECRRLHRAAAEWLLEQRAAGAQVDVVELARHLSRCSLGPDARAAAALQDAGDALAAPTPRSAAVWYRQAVAHVDGAGPAWSSLHVRLARALRRAGEPAEVVRVCRTGLQAAEGDDRDRLTRYLATALADSGSLHEALGVVDVELARRGPSAVLLTTRALLARLQDDLPGADAAVEHAAAIARTVDERLAVLFQRLNLGTDRGAGAASAAARAELERLIPLLDPEHRVMAHAHAAGAWMGWGAIDKATAHLEAVDALQARGVVNVDWPWSFAARVGVEVYGGRWDDAVRTYERGAPEFGAGLRLLARNHAATVLADVTFARQDLERAERCLADLIALSAQAGRLGVLVRSKLLHLQGRPAEALALLDSALAEAPPSAAVRMWFLVTLVQLQAARGTGVALLGLLEQLQQHAEAVDSAYARVVLAAARARVADDVEAAGAGLTLVAEHGLRCYEPDLRFDLGRLGVEPEANLTAALRQYSSLGAVEAMVRTETEMRRRRIRVPSGPPGERFSLTDAERRVARLAAEGLTNRAIGERLAYSVKTIEAYLSRIYAKTGCANRVELARYLATPVPGVSNLTSG